jgi:acyl-CoA synthetase (AMP-forming)/AMP-acid ligase II
MGDLRISLLVEMAGDALGDRPIVGSKRGGMSAADLLTKARRAAAWAKGKGVGRIGLIGANSDAVPVALMAASLSGLPFVPLNFRLADDRLRAILARVTPAVVVVDEGVADRVGSIEGVELVGRDEFLAMLDDPGLDVPVEEPDEDIAVLLFTSGTTGEPKGAVLRHSNLSSYVLGTVEFLGAAEDEATLVSVPPYHIAGLMVILTSIYGGRRLFYLSSFDPEGWVETVRDECITQAMVVPTMLGRILDVLEASGEKLPALRAISYGGGRMPVPVIERALRLLPEVNFVNAYGLTETSSTVAVLTPEDHREAVASEDPAVRRRLGSVGKPIHTLELEVRDLNGDIAPPGVVGEIWVRGDQVSGEYLDRDDKSAGGWFRTRDSGWLDDSGYLFVEGRLDDVIVRGAENVSPGEIEEVLVEHPAVAEAAVVGVPDEEWGEHVAAAVVLEPGHEVTAEELRTWVRDRLRSSRTPHEIEFRDELPYNETGKLLRRVLRDELAAMAQEQAGPARS